MATWHQQKNRSVLFHDTLWTIVNDPPGECRTLSVFPTKAGAEEQLAIWRTNNPAAYQYCYILRPRCAY